MVSEEEPGASDEDGDDGDDSFDDSAKGDTPEKPTSATVGIPRDPPQTTHVHVVVVSCKGLRGADFTGYSDPFVEVGAFGATKNRRFRTKPCRQTLNPSWNTNESRFLVACDASSSDDGGGGVPFQGLVFSVFDKDLGSSSQFLGGAAIAAKDVPTRGRWMETELTLTRSHPPGAIAEAETDAKAAKYAVDRGQRGEGRFDRSGRVESSRRVCGRLARRDRSTPGSAGFLPIPIDRSTRSFGRLPIPIRASRAIALADDVGGKVGHRR